MSSPRKSPKPKYKSASGEEFQIPRAEEAERAILGCVLLNNKAIYVAQEIVRIDDFFNQAHRRIFASMIVMDNLGIEIDTVGLFEKLSDDKLLEAIGGVGYLSKLTDGLPKTSNVAHYAKIVKQKAALRNVVTFSSDVFHKAIESGAEPEELIQKAESQLRQIQDQDSVNAREAVTIKQAVQEAMPMIERIFDGTA
jgi:replicative DNA helicase